MGCGSGLGRFGVEKKYHAIAAGNKKKSIVDDACHMIWLRNCLKQESQKSVSTEIYSSIENGNFNDKKRKLFQIMAR